VRLIGVAAHQGQSGPVGRGASAGGRRGTLEALDTSEQLGCHADLGAEDLNQSAMAEPDVRGHVPHARARLGQPCQRDGHGAVALARAVQARDQRPFENAKAPLGCGLFAQALAQLVRLTAPERLEVQVQIAELGGQCSEDRERAAGLEMHPHDGGVLERVDDEG